MRNRGKSQILKYGHTNWLNTSTLGDEWRLLHLKTSINYFGWFVMPLFSFWYWMLQFHLPKGNLRFVTWKKTRFYAARWRWHQVSSGGKWSGLQCQLTITSDETINISRKKGRIQHTIFIEDIRFIDSYDVYSQAKQTFAFLTGASLFLNKEFDSKAVWIFGIKAKTPEENQSLEKYSSKSNRFMSLKYSHFEPRDCRWRSPMV